MEQAGFPAGWDEQRVLRVLAHYEDQTAEEAVAEDEAVYEDPDQAMIEVPNDLLPAVREFLAKRRAKPLAPRGGIMSSSRTLPAGLELVQAGSQHVGEMGRICYEAFKDLHEGHHLPLDLPSAELARQVVGMMVSRSDFYSVVALLDGQVVGSNFLSLSDAVAGIGPVSVEPRHQGKDIGLALMRDVVAHGQHRGIESIRLLQETINAASLSLYASMGFDAREEVAYLQATPSPAEDTNCRPVTDQDLPAVERLSAEIYRTSRRNEVAAAIRYELSPLLYQRDGRVTGYLVPGLFGHGVAESEDDACALVGEMARRLPPQAARFFCPVRQASFFRRVLRMRCRTIKVWTLMTLGSYEPPREVWMPSVLY